MDSDRHIVSPRHYVAPLLPPFPKKPDVPLPKALDGCVLVGICSVSTLILCAVQARSIGGLFMCILVGCAGTVGVLMLVSAIHDRSAPVQAYKKPWAAFREAASDWVQETGQIVDANHRKYADTPMHVVWVGYDAGIDRLEIHYMLEADQAGWRCVFHNHPQVEASNTLPAKSVWFPDGHWDLNAASDAWYFAPGECTFVSSDLAGLVQAIELGKTWCFPTQYHG